MRRGELARTLVKLGAFTMVCVFCAVLVTNTLTRPLGQAATGFTALFTDAGGVRPGSDIRIAGVRVGQVDAVQARDGVAVVSFEVTDDQHVPADVTAAVRYADLLGERYIALSAGGGHAGALPPGATVPLERTKPALDLTALFNGFKPVFQLLQPAEVNQLAKEIVAVFQGEGPTINALLSKTVSLTRTFAGQDQVIGRVLANLQPVLDTMIGHEQDFKDLVSGLGALVHGLAGNRRQLTDALDSGAELSATVSDIVRAAQPAAQRDIAALNEFSGALVTNQRPIVEALGDLPKALGKLDTVLGYGAWVNVYFCGLGINLGPATIDLGAGPHSAVC
jgi:phospholipid/cholesterol/gamma-HCH transport system substrate-binding protein